MSLQLREPNSGCYSRQASPSDVHILHSRAMAWDVEKNPLITTAIWYLRVSSQYLQAHPQPVWFSTPCGTAASLVRRMPITATSSVASWQSPVRCLEDPLRPLAGAVLDLSDPVQRESKSVPGWGFLPMGQSESWTDPSYKVWKPGKFKGLKVRFFPVSGWSIVRGSWMKRQTHPWSWWTTSWAAVISLPLLGEAEELWQMG